MKRTRFHGLRQAGVATAVSLLVLSAAGCGGTEHKGSSADKKQASEKFAPQPGFDPKNFGTSTEIDNTWFPMKPGTEHTYDGTTVDDGERVKHGIVFTVTDMTKMIDGVETIVVWERDFKEGQLEEAELSFFAQADDGDVWLFGEYPAEYDGGAIVKAADGWIPGYDGAQPGIQIKAEPKLHEPSYAEGWAPKVDWTDRARAYKLGQKTCVAAGCYTNVLVNEEYSKQEPGTFQLKYYAPGVGNVRVGWRGKSQDKETVELTKIKQLSAKDMADVRGEVLALEKHAYQNPKFTDSYAKTAPVERG